MVISLSAKGLTTGEISAHLAEVYGAEVSRQTISTITDKVIEGMTEWQNRPLDPVYPVIFIDAIHVKIRDGQGRQPAHLRRAGGHLRGPPRHPRAVGRGRRRGRQVLAARADRAEEPRRGRRADGGLRRADRACPRRSTPVWPRAVVQTCVVHLLRNSFRYAGRQHWDAIAKALRPVYTAPTEAAAQERFGEFAEAWGEQVPGDRAAVGERLGRVRAVPGLRRRDPPGRSARPTRSRASTPGSAGRSRPAATSPTSRPPSNASTWRS